jgi:hypothetical protein
MNPPVDGYLDMEGLERYSSMSRRWWRARLKEIPVLRLPGKHLFRISDIDAFLLKFREAPPDLCDAYRVAEELTSRVRRMKRTRSKKEVT